MVLSYGALLRVVMVYFKGVLNYMHGINGQGLLKATNLLLKNYSLWHDYPP